MLLTAPMRRLSCAMTAALGVMVLPGCGTDGGGAEPGPAADDPGAAFAQCLRDNGVDVRDPAPGRPVVVDGSVDQAALAAAQEACRDLAPVGGGGGAGAALPDIDALVALSGCLRDRGFDVPDPRPGPGGQVTQQLGGGVDLDDPALVEARQECAREVGIDLPGQP
ncbi:hypothetical protein [Blastococcus sp. TF02A-26]|uniref:hypothetical protein n=1 Tax=Blastococcus sp. TF02A-26 TaxID=2250577 RepID=UPI001314319B|nr:hypothetical protein [Blastococcus sp. TF02A-26]